jgi:hypothetical protein
VDAERRPIGRLLWRVRTYYQPFYDFALHYCKQHDEESQHAIWEELKDDIVREHIKYSPGTRPWGWWKWEAPEMHRVIAREVDPDNKGDCLDDRVPAAEDPNLPEWAKGKFYFGKPSVYAGFVYEDERDYLDRQDLLFEEERD